MAVTTDSAWEDDEWEICNDNGFVYKRRRRRRTAVDAEDGRPPSSDDTEAELRRHRRERRRRCLLGLREKYRRELEQWEALSFTLLDLTSPIPTAPSAPPPPPPPPPEPPGVSFAPSIDDLLSQVESQEAILRKVSEICDFVESVCKGQEERLAESLIGLPIWGSPRSLIASLSD